MNDVEHKGIDLPPERGSHQLRRVLTLREAVALGVGGTIGGGIFVLVGAAARRAGPGALLAFLLAFGVSLLIALPYAELACRYPLAGGGYAFARALLGPHWGFLMGWGYWGAYIFISGYVTLGFGGYLHALTGLPPISGALALIGISTGINLVGVRLSGLVQSLVIGVAIVALLAFGVLGLPHVHIAQFTPFLPYGIGGVAVATLLDFLAFIALTGSVMLLAVVGGFLYVLHFLFPLIALVILRRRGGPSPAFRTPAPQIVLPLACGGCLLLLVTSGWTGVLGGLGWLCVGLLAYGGVQISRRAGNHRRHERS